jgi:sugar lactone lactonase YvrE
MRLIATLLAAPLLAACGGTEAGEPAVPACDPEEPGTICTIVGEGTRGYGGDDGPALLAHIDTPQDMVVMPDGELWLLDFNNYLVRALDDDGNIRTVIGTGLLGDSPAPEETRVPALEAKFNHTTDLFVHDGYLYLAAWHNTRIKRVELSSMMLENFAGIGQRMLYTGDGGPALEAALDLPSSIAVDAEGNIAIMDQANQVIRSVDADGNIHCLAGTCVVEAAGTSCEPGQVPTACPGSNKTTCGDPEETCDLPCTPGYGGDGEDALRARLAQPFGQMADPAGRIAFDAEGNLILADSNNHRIRKVDLDGIITTIAGTGVAGASGDGGEAVRAKLNNPVDVEVAADGTIYFTDTYNSCIRKIDTDGIIDTVAGHCGTGSGSRGFAGDGGPPQDALLARPYGIELDGDRLYIADSYNHRIRVVNLD